MKMLNSGINRCPYCGSFIPCAPNPPDSLPPGYVLGKRFITGKVTGRDASGFIYTVYDQRLQTLRSMKEFFPRQFIRRPDMSTETPPGLEGKYKTMHERFLQEVWIMSVMSEEKVSGTIDVFDRIRQNGNECVLMEHLNGSTLDETLTRQGKGFPWQESVRMMRSVLQTLCGIHALGFLHRNISLSNVFRMQDGSVRVIGFGSAEPTNLAKTDPGKMWPSSKRYYSPGEQIANSVQGPWTDIYAAGACLFKATAGGWPANHRNGDVFPSLLSLGINIPAGLDRIISKATQPEPRKRYPTAEAMLDALKRVSEEKPK